MIRNLLFAACLAFLPSLPAQQLEYKTMELRGFTGPRDPSLITAAHRSPHVRRSSHTRESKCLKQADWKRVKPDRVLRQAAYTRSR